MKFLLPIVAALVAPVALPAAAQAQAQTGYYVAVPEAQPTRATLVTRNTAWHAQGNALVADRAPERHQILCQLVARSTGPLASFTVRGKAYDADELAACNAKVKPAAQVTASAK